MHPKTYLDNIDKSDIRRINSQMLKDIKNFVENVKPLRQLEDQIALLEKKVAELESRNE